MLCKEEVSFTYGKWDFHYHYLGNRLHFLSACQFYSALAGIKTKSGESPYVLEKGLAIWYIMQSRWTRCKAINLWGTIDTHRSWRQLLLNVLEHLKIDMIVKLNCKPQSSATIFQCVVIYVIATLWLKITKDVCFVLCFNYALKKSWIAATKICIQLCSALPTGLSVILCIRNKDR